jgi:hypothetical protein
VKSAVLSVDMQSLFDLFTLTRSLEWESICSPSVVSSVRDARADGTVGIEVCSLSEDGGHRSEKPPKGSLSCFGVRSSDDSYRIEDECSYCC